MTPAITAIRIAQRNTLYALLVYPLCSRSLISFDTASGRLNDETIRMIE